MRTLSPLRAGLSALVAAAVIAAPLAAVPVRAQSPEAAPPDTLPPGVTPLPDLPSPNPRAPNLLEPPAELPSARPHLPPGHPETDQETAGKPEPKAEPTLDSLFTDLANAKDDRTAGQVANRIQRRLAASGSATIDVLMGQAQAAIGAENLPLALDLLDAVTRLQPAFAEGWSRRAAVHYQRDDFGKALADLEYALALEPRDWRTLVGLGVVLRALDREEAALKAYEAALAVHPRNEEAKKAHDDLAAEVRGVEL
ncbi:tetratricopeptide repeat protein [Pseudoxanthobacter sp. M-2]|uniref:tetratricopeptide repeat protein n=1 Tax=Pseudoxanthobacter sp. M-2 TaxID=3078754 RepID=UPI0038FC75CD